MLQHPHSQKKDIIIDMVDRAFLLSEPKFHEKNLTLVINTLNNDYPLNFIFNTVNNRLKSLLHKKTNKQTDSSSSENVIKKSPWFLVPYVPRISNKFKNIFRDLDIKLSFHSINKLNKFKPQKDTLTVMSNKNVVYQISCKNCNATYGGQTMKQLKTRTPHRYQQKNR